MLFSQLSTEDKNKIEYYITHYANESRGKEYTPLEAPLDHILRFWNLNKRDLYTILGNKFTTSKFISIDKPVDLISSDLCHKDDVIIFLNELQLCLDDWFSQKRHCSWSIYEHLMAYARYWSTELCTNKAQHEVDVKINGERIKIAKGERATKVIRKLVKVFNIDEEKFEKFRIAHSQVLNDKKIEGELCISIHPLDFMTMSDNSLNWASCMKWEKNGCYKAGTVEMMNSPNVVVAYLRHPTDMTFGEDMIWNNKRWRCLYIVEGDMIMSVKSYPYFNENLLTITGNFIAELFNTNTKYHDRFDITRASIEEWASEWVLPWTTSKRRINEFVTDLMYNDIEESWGYHYILTDLKTDLSLSEEDELPFTSVEYSGESECVICGNTWYGNNEDLICDSYHTTHRCAHCNTLCLDEETMFIYKGNYYCEKCHQQYFRHCVITGKLYYHHDVYSIPMVRDINKRATGDNVIKYFYVNVNDYWNVRKNTEHWFTAPLQNIPEDFYIGYYGFTPEMLTEYGKTIFKIEGENE